jgi:transcription elongation GreA/GreB family factor
MSKAFTSEEPEGPEVKGRLVARARRGEERPITAAGYRALVEQVRRLSEEALPSARREGAATDVLEGLQHQLDLATASLESVRVVHAPADAEGRVTFGATVTVSWDDGRTQRFAVVGPDEASAADGRVSVESPLARAVLDLRVGEVVELRLPQGLATGVVAAVEPPHQSR